MDRAVIVERLTKEFVVTKRKKGLIGAFSSLVAPEKKTIHALKGISFSLTAGELVGFIGPNGAGKTTTMKILSGILYPTSGYVQVDGFTPWARKKEFLKSISLVMGQKNQLWWDLPAQETFELNKAIYELPDREYKKSLSELVELLDVEDLLDVQVRRLSLGQRMRMELIAALLHRPKTIFLDEPTIGLDVIAQQKMRDFIAQYNKNYNATILLTSHNMDDLKNLAKRVIVIDEGQIVFDGLLSELSNRFAHEKIIKLHLSDGGDLKKLESIGKIIQMDMPEVSILVPRGVVKAAAAELLRSFPVEDISIEEEPLDEIIRKVFRSAAKPSPKKKKR